MLVVYITACVLLCLPFSLYFCLCSWASGDKRFTTYTISCIREQWEACLWVCMLVHLLVCVQYCFAYCVCLWINRAWMMLMLMMVSEHEIWQSVHWFLPFGCIFTVISCSLILFGSFSVPGTLLCAKTPSCGLGVCSVGFRLLNAYVFNVSASQMFYPVWERFSDCQMRHIFFVLLSSPFQWSWHCYGAHVLYCRSNSFLLWTKSCSTTQPLCMRSSVQKRLSAHSWSLES